MDGRKYNREVCLHILLYEALMRLTWNGFLSCLEANHLNGMLHLNKTLRAIASLGEDVPKATLNEVLENSSCTQIIELFEDYCTLLRGGNSNLSTSLFRCPICTWLISCWGLSEHQKREFRCYTWQVFEQ